MIIPWSCHVCAKQFDKYAGGICAKCKKSTCLKHLKLFGYVKDQGPAKTSRLLVSIASALGKYGRS